MSGRHHNPPKQSRSARTLERLVAASLDLLDEGGPEALTVHSIVSRAGSSVGSFYARFGGKEDLLDYLGERVWTEAIERWDEALANRDWSGLTLAQIVEGAVGLLLDAQRSRSSYLRALDRVPGTADDAYLRFRDHLGQGIGSLLLARRLEIEHRDPELAVRLGLMAVMGVVDGAGTVDRDDLARECRDLLVGYLGGDVPGAGAGGEDVDFFDIWA